jgi:hypothetical protein
MSRTYRYQSLKDDSTSPPRILKFPFLQVTLDYRGNKTVVAGLLDTGAVDCIFDKAIADDLGIDITDTAITKDYVGIADQTETGYIHRVRLQVQGFNEWIEVEAGFLNREMQYPLLGQSGVFDNYQVTFKRYQGRFELKSRSFLHAGRFLGGH